MQYPSNVRIIRVLCSGMVDINYLIRAFECGVDGVFVAGCLKGGCHFVKGNLHAEVRMKFVKALLEAIGIGGERAEMFFISSSMAPQFVEAVKEMTDRITKLGPLPKRVSLTERLAEINKREFLYNMLKNLALRIPEKPIPVPEGLEEFGKIECDLVKCIGCKRCEEVCPEKAIDFIGEFDLPAILQTVTAGGEGKVTKRRLLYETLAKIATKQPSKAILVPDGMGEFYKIQYRPRKCVVCDKCVNICPEKALNVVREVDLPAILT
jgi:coenzyme F420-reducing hydrogenase delta subunit/ferredoxin